MKIAVTYDNNGNIFQHFGHTEYVKVYDVQEENIVNTTVLSTDGSGHSAIADFLNDADAKVLICGGIGPCAISALQEYGITLCAGVSGNADEAVKNFIKGSLNFVSEANCDHNHDDKEHNHSCGHCH